MSLFDKICRALIKMIRKKPEYKKLWQNASPTSTFNPQALSLDGLAVKGVDGVRILTKRNSSDTDGALYITDIPLNEFSGKEIPGFRRRGKERDCRRVCERIPSVLRGGDDHCRLFAKRPDRAA